MMVLYIFSNGTYIGANVSVLSVIGNEVLFMGDQRYKELIPERFPRPCKVSSICKIETVLLGFVLGCKSSEWVDDFKNKNDIGTKLTIIMILLIGFKCTILWYFDKC